MHKVSNTKESLVSLHKFKHFVVFRGGDREGLEKCWDLRSMRRSWGWKGKGDTSHLFIIRLNAWYKIISGYILHVRLLPNSKVLFLLFITSRKHLKLFFLLFIALLHMSADYVVSYPTSTKDSSTGLT